MRHIRTNICDFSDCGTDIVDSYKSVSRLLHSNELPKDKCTLILRKCSLIISNTLYPVILFQFLELKVYIGVA